MAAALVLRGGRILDPESGAERIGDVRIDERRIVQVGGEAPVHEPTQVVDVSGMLVAPGFIDIHAHLFGPIGFASADSIGIAAGVTTVCDAGGAAVDTFEDFMAQVPARATTSVFSWLFIGPGGLDTGTADGRLQTTVRNKIPVLRLGALQDVVARYGDIIIGIKTPAFGELAGPGAMKIAKGLAELVERPLYVHIGDLQLAPEQWAEATQPAFDELGPGDVITHCYTPNPGGLLDEQRRLQKPVAAALDRGVLLDVGFGAFNFDFTVARTVLDQDITPFIISSDLQQANVLGPVHSLANVMSAFLALGMPLHDVIRRVTANAAKLIGRDARIGALEVGRAADLTIFELEEAPVEFSDTAGGRLMGERRIVPRITVKDGDVHSVDLEAATRLDNWSMNSVLALGEDPPATELSPVQREFLSDVAAALDVESEWTPARVHASISRLIALGDLAVGEADNAILGAYLNNVFPQAPGYLLGGLDREFVLQRLRSMSEPVTAHP